MRAIFKKDNVYVLIDDLESREDVNLSECEELIYDTYEKTSANLYGGRVSIIKDYDFSLWAKLSVDGIEIGQYKCWNQDFSKNTKQTLSQIVAFLNQIENLGVDTFLENYRKQIESLKNEIEEKVKKLEDEQAIHFDEDKQKFINKFNDIIIYLTCVIFSLLINMNAGLDNQTYNDAYNEIVSLYF